MTMEAERIDGPTKDPVSNVLKWILLVVAVAQFRAARLDDQADLRSGAPLSRPLRYLRRRRPDVGRRYRRPARQAFRKPT